MDQVKHYEVTLGFEGEKALIMTVPTLGDEAAARRRAIFSLAARHPHRDMDTIFVVKVEEVP